MCISEKDDRSGYAMKGHMVSILLLGQYGVVGMAQTDVKQNKLKKLTRIVGWTEGTDVPAWG